jgi:hypothetical protein
MILAYVGSVVLVVGAAGMGRTGDHRGPDCGNTVCVPVADQKKVTTKTYSSKTEEFCQTPLRRLFGHQPECGPVRTKRVLVLHQHTTEVPTTKYIPAVPPPCAEPACPPAVAVQPVPGAVPTFYVPQPVSGAVPTYVPPPGPVPGQAYFVPPPGSVGVPTYVPPPGPVPGQIPVYPGQFPVYPGQFPQ